MPPAMNYAADRARLIDSLQSVRRRVRFLSVLFGVGIVVACTVGVFLVTMSIDYLLDLPKVPRLLFMIAAVGSIGYAMFEYVVKPLLAKLTIGDIAGKVESAFPVFDDRLRSTVNFTDNQDVPGSDVMKQRTVAEAVRLAGHLDLNQVVVSRPVWYSVGTAVGAVALVVLLAILINPEYLRTAIAHLNPFSDRPWPRQYQISADALPGRVPVGQRIDVRMKLTKGDKPSAKAVVYYQYDNGPILQEYMTRGSDGTYTASLDAKGEGLKVWMKSGDDETPQAGINVVPRLAIREVGLQVTPPAYAKLGSTTINLVNMPGLVTFGSEVKLQIGFNKPLDASQPVVIESVGGDVKAPAVEWNRGQPAAPIGTWQAKDSLHFRVHATDTDGFQNTALEEFELIVRPDQMPTVTIEKPRGNESHTPDATVHLKAVAEDDFGLRYGKLVVERIGRAGTSTTQPATGASHWEIPLTNWKDLPGTPERRRFDATYDWELAKLADADLKPGDVLEYFVQVQDNFELDGKVHAAVNSGRLRISIISHDELNNIVTDAMRQISEKVQQVQNAQKNTKEATKQVLQDTKDKPEFTKGDRDATEKRINEQSTLASQTKTLAQQVDNLQQQLNDNKSTNAELKDLTNDVKNQLNQTAENPMKEAIGKLNEANQQKVDPKASPEQRNQQTDQRNQAMEKSQASQQKAADQLQKALDRMSSIGTLSKTIEAWQKLLDKQKETSDQTQKIGKDNLGKKPEEMNKDDRDKLAKAAEEQKKLGEQTDKAANDMQKTAEQMAKSDPAAAQAMKQAAQQAQSQQISQKQQQAAQQAQQNQQSQAQNNQKQAEFGLQVVIDTLREAERRKLEQLIKQLDEAQKQIANLIRRQAGHNIDNLGLQGGDKTKLVTDELLAKAERTKEHLPPVPELPQLTGGQEQTERNTSDVTKTVGDIQGAAEAVANLTRAASKMGYAIIGLRDKKLPEAYDPNQTEALASLEAALQQVSKQKQDAQDKQDASQKEKMREAYIKIRDEQIKINEQTAKLDKSKNPDGTMKHADQVALGQLPGIEGKLAEKTDELGKDLTGSSIVYVWANRDIVTSMKEVKDDLNKPDTGNPTQAEQTRIVEQLQAMIDNLAIKPPEKSPFAQKSDGGGKGSGGPKKNKLPTEAELRMLKDLQLAVNKSTQKIDGEPRKDKPKLVALGNRQGQLRNLLDQLLQSASDGQIKLPPEPDKKDQLPEEASNETIEDQELAKTLLEDKPLEDKAQKDTNLIGDRMARVRQRLSDTQDPGKTTQKIEEKIVANMDQLIEIARQSQQQAQSQGQGKPQDGPPKPGEGQAQGENQGKQPGQQPGQPNAGQQAAQSDSATAANENNANLNNNMKETANNWGNISPRIHDAVVEGASEKVPQKYRKLVEDYYRSLATKATGQGK